MKIFTLPLLALLAVVLGSCSKITAEGDAFVERLNNSEAVSAELEKYGLKVNAKETYINVGNILVEIESEKPTSTETYTRDDVNFYTVEIYTLNEHYHDLKDNAMRLALAVAAREMPAGELDNLVSVLEGKGVGVTENDYEILPASVIAEFAGTSLDKLRLAVVKSKIEGGLDDYNSIVRIDPVQVTPGERSYTIRDKYSFKTSGNASELVATMEMDPEIVTMYSNKFGIGSDLRSMADYLDAHPDDAMIDFGRIIAAVLTSVSSPLDPLQVTDMLGCTEVRVRLAYKKSSPEADFVIPVSVIATQLK